MSKFITWYLNLKFKQKLLLSFLVIIFLTTLCISGTNYAVSNLLITRYVSDTPLRSPVRLLLILLPESIILRRQTL